ncbi:hypothetical protein PTKIN_Ptkin04bG0130000 [Pterospermum kingtungense]
MDRITARQQRLAYAKICVEVDPSMEIPKVNNVEMREAVLFRWKLRYLGDTQKLVEQVQFIVGTGHNDKGKATVVNSLPVVVHSVSTNQKDKGKATTVASFPLVFKYSSPLLFKDKGIATVVFTSANRFAALSEPSITEVGEQSGKSGNCVKQVQHVKIHIMEQYLDHQVHLDDDV